MATKCPKKAPKKPTTGKKPAKPRAPGTKSALSKAIVRYEAKLATEEEIKMADYVRLLQLKKELSGEGPQEVTVRWVDPWADALSDGK